MIVGYVDNGMKTDKSSYGTPVVPKLCVTLIVARARSKRSALHVIYEREPCASPYLATSREFSYPELFRLVNKRTRSPLFIKS
jgi:hypothetical protein